MNGDHRSQDWYLSYRFPDLNEAVCAADAAREVVERWLPSG
jgi:hypothetical protein